MVDALGSNSSSALVKNLLQLRKSMEGLERQLATGKKSDTYGGLGPERSLSVSFRSGISRLESYQSSITMVDLRLSVSDLVVTRISDIGVEARAALDPNIYQLLGNGKTQGQATALNLLGETLSLLNTDAGGRYLFAGQDVSNKPVESMNAILDGDGSRAGFLQHKTERLLADMGTNDMGRIDVAQPVPNQVQLAEDGAHPFGFKMDTVNSNLSNVTVTGPSGSPSVLGIDFTGQPLVGETLTLNLVLPDGSNHRIELSAALAGQGSEGHFEIGATADDTSANLAASLTTALQNSAGIQLRTASGIAAGEDFFNTDGGAAPQRIDGPPFASASALRDATAADTVIWYKGENNSSSARKSATARIDDNITINYGARANEEAFRVTIQNLAVYASETFSTSDPNDEARYTELTSKALTSISYGDGVQSLQQIAGELGAARNAAGNANSRHISMIGNMQTVVDGVETADINEVSVSLLTLQTRLEASYRATSILFSMSLTNFL